MSRLYKAYGRDRSNTVKSQIFNMDNGAGTTIDETIMCRTKQVKLLSARFVEDTETAGTVNAATIQLGTTVGGVDVIAATGYTNAAVVGAVQTLTLKKTIIQPNTPLIVRHTGIASVVAGQGHLEVEYMEF